MALVVSLFQAREAATNDEHVGQWGQARRGEAGGVVVSQARRLRRETASGKAAWLDVADRGDSGLDVALAQGTSVRGSAGRLRRGRPGRGSNRWASAKDSSVSWHQGRAVGLDHHHVCVRTVLVR
jgi:hypothetical protein